MTCVNLTADEVAQAFALKGRHRALSANDCFCLVTAHVNRGILLTGDAFLRKVATDRGLRVHGVLWVIDELARAETCDISLLVEALRAWKSDGSVFLPRDEICKRLESLAGRF